MLEDNSFSKYIWTKQTCHTNIISKKKNIYQAHYKNTTITNGTFLGLLSICTKSIAKEQKNL
jgi:hypothetical protein